MVVEKYTTLLENINRSNQFEDLTDLGEVRNGDACYSDPEDFIDDITDEELLEDFLIKKPKSPDSFESLIIVDNIPIVGSEKFDKLKMVLKKKFGQFGKILNEFLPVNSEGFTKGYSFYEYETYESAKRAVNQMDNFPFDKSHIFRVNLISDAKKFDQLDPSAPLSVPLSYKEIDNLYDWLLHPDGYDQFLVLSELDNRQCLLSIYLNIITGPQLILEKEKWSDKKATWSPLGTYLVTYHHKGIALYGTKTFEQIKRFPHSFVEYIFFSPCERFFFTFSSKMALQGEAIVLWEVLSGEKLRVFPYNTTPIYQDQPFWPPFKWSHDGSFFACISKPDTLSIYSTKLIPIVKSSMNVKDIVDFEWSPKENMLSYWVRQDKEIPAKLFLISVPDKSECRPSSTLGNVINCKMLWNEEYLAVLTERYAKKKKVLNKDSYKYVGISYVFEIFHLHQPQIPKDTIEFKNKIVHFQLEPYGNKLALITEHSAGKNVCIYEINIGGKAPSLLKELTLQKFNRIFWSPNGQFVVLAETGLRSDSGALMFLDTNDMTKMAEAYHPYVDIVKWDFKGRFVATAVTLNHSKDNGFRIWTFQGKQLSQVLYDKLRDFDWRPRLSRDLKLLPDEKIKEIKKTLKKYSEIYDSQDKALYTQAAKELTDKRKKEKEEFMKYMRSKDDRIKKIREMREALLKDSDKLEEETYDILQSEETITLGKL